MPYIRLFLVAAASVTVTFAANPSIGIAVADAPFQFDKSSVYGNATLFDGSLIETAAVSSDLVLHNGARLVLEKGQTEISATSKYSIEALGGKAAKSDGSFWRNPKVIIAGVAVGASAGVAATSGQAKSTISAQ
jgi:hypothetical protein